MTQPGGSPTPVRPSPAPPTPTAAIDTGDPSTPARRRADRLVHEHRHRRRTCATCRHRSGSTSRDRGRRLDRRRSTADPPCRCGTPPRPPGRLDPGAARRCSPPLRRDRCRRRTATLTITPGCRDDRHGRRPGLRRHPAAGLPFTLDPAVADGGRRTRRTDLAPSRRPPCRSTRSCRAPSRARPVGVARPRPVARRRRPRARPGLSARSRGSAVRHGRRRRLVPRAARRPDPAGRRFIPGPPSSTSSDAEALHRVAERLDTLVLHHAGPDERRLRRPRRRHDLPLRRPGVPRPRRGSPGPGAGPPRRAPRT